MDKLRFLVLIILMDNADIDCMFGGSTLTRILNAHKCLTDHVASLMERDISIAEDRCVKNHI